MILGIDPGLANTGWAVLDCEPQCRLIACGVIKTSKGEDRLGKIYVETEEIVRRYKVDKLALESLFFAKNAKSAIKVAEAIGVIKLCGQRNKLRVKEYTPLRVKMALVGYGRAEKEQVEVMIRQLLNLNEAISPSHASDAVAVALTEALSMDLE